MCVIKRASAKRIVEKKVVHVRVRYARKLCLLVCVYIYI